MSDDQPSELRGVSPDPTGGPTTPAWVRVTAVLLVVAMIGFVLAQVL